MFEVIQKPIIDQVEIGMQKMVCEEFMLIMQKIEIQSLYVDDEFLMDHILVFIVFI
jgi:hypothetical protein